MVNKSVLDDDRKFLTLTLVLPVLLFSVSFLLSYYSCNHATSTEKNPSTSTTFSTVEVIAGGVKIERNPSESKLTQLGVSSWPKYFPFLLFFLFYSVFCLSLFSFFSLLSIYHS